MVAVQVACSEGGGEGSLGEHFFQVEVACLGAIDVVYSECDVAEAEHHHRRIVLSWVAAYVRFRIIRWRQWEELIS